MTALFYVTGQAHTIVGGSAWEPTPWRAVQKAGVGGGAQAHGRHASLRRRSNGMRLA
jgi:hypothetical protein